MKRECVLLSYGACNSCCMSFSKLMIFTNSVKFTVYIVGTDGIVGQYYSQCLTVHSVNYVVGHQAHNVIHELTLFVNIIDIA